ncbi:MAG: endonuclease [Alphaproteobacteria bacterium]|nr:endonuclease [Alphaproteobacteria bacterium]
MRIAPLLLLLAACSRTPPGTGPGDDDDDVTTGDDDDDVTGDDDDDTATQVGDDDDDDDTTGCSTSIDADADGSNQCDDCDDNDPNRHPNARERCNEIDDDCDGAPLPDESPACQLCDAEGFWFSTRNLTGSTLTDELRNLLETNTCRDYSTETTFMFVDLDKHNGEVECVYTGRTTPVGSSKPDATDMNTEHSWPQSMGADTIPARCDLNHLYPTDSDANSVRGNLPFGIVTSANWSEGGSQRGTDGSLRTVFEPRDAHKGNVSRSMLYFSLQYGYSIDAATLDLYQAWSAQDVVDQAEIDRALAIEARQRAVNPYVLCPWLVDEL